jgi:predicted DNA-binding antitoxin AbrB/MazE fold protein
MTETFEAVFDGTVFRPQGKVKLKPNTRVHITVEADEPNGSEGHEKPARPDYSEPGSFLRLGRSSEPTGPTDMSTRLDEYLYQGATLDDGSRLNDAD